MSPGIVIMACGSKIIAPPNSLFFITTVYCESILVVATIFSVVVFLSVNSHHSNSLLFKAARPNLSTA